MPRASSTPWDWTGILAHSPSARRLAGEAGFTNVEFHEADVEREEYARWRPDLVTAYLCASDAIVELAGRALAPGQCLAMVAFHVDQWRETGKVSRFAYDESRMERVLRASGFLPEVIEVESDVLRFASVEEGSPPRWAWKTSGAPTGAGSATSRFSRRAAAP